ncbi:MATE family efflux transporter [Butyrivibrio sp. AE3009]|uniref:MATE family efflux transporter n=1 Tax=Butyrivibrio sp. AE3009 TaxID=1280666 RepID=UPI0003B38BDB|nr:MATE family efflux transporter [Butyrivibrio sp. AE3009]
MTEFGLSQAGRKPDKMAGDMRLMKDIISLVLPAIIEYSFQALVNYADFIMVGKLGIAASATIGITNEVTFLVKAGVNALGVGVLAYFAKEIGAGRRKGLKRATLQAYILALIIGIFTTVIPLAISPFLPVFLGAAKEIQRPASIYFAVASSAGVFFSFNVVAGSIRKAAKDMKTPLVVNGLVNVLNIIFNWFLIYPSLNLKILGRDIVLPRADMGVTGAAAGTAIAVAIGGVLMLWVNERSADTSARGSLVDIRDFKKTVDTDIINKYVTVGIPAFLTSVVTSFGRVIFTSMIVPLGTVVYAAHSIAFTAESAFYIPAVGMASAVAALSGNVRGEGDIKKLNRQTNLVCVMIVCIMLVATGIMMLFAEDIISIFTKDPSALEIAPRLLRIVAVNEPFFGISIVMQYVFNGIGKTKPPLFVSAFTQWVLRVGGVFLFVSVLGYGIEAAWICMISDNIGRAILLYIWYWVSNKKLLYW